MEPSKVIFIPSRQDELQAPHDDVSRHVILGLLAEVARLRAIIDKHLPKTADGKLVCECDVLYCPYCSHETAYRGVAVCDWCDEPGVPGSSRGLFDTECFADQGAARAAIKARKVNEGS